MEKMCISAPVSSKSLQGKYPISHYNTSILIEIFTILLQIFPYEYMTSLFFVAILSMVFLAPFTNRKFYKAERDKHLLEERTIQKHFPIKRHGMSLIAAKMDFLCLFTS